MIYNLHYDGVSENRGGGGEGGGGEGETHTYVYTCTHCTSRQLSSIVQGISGKNEQLQVKFESTGVLHIITCNPFTCTCTCMCIYIYMYLPTGSLDSC